MWYIFTIEYYSAIKMNKIMPFAATWMDLETVIHRDNLCLRERQISYAITYRCNLKKMVKMNLLLEVESQT